MLWMFCAAFGVACVACTLWAVLIKGGNTPVRLLFSVGAVVLLVLTVVAGVLASGHNVAGIGGGYPVEAADGFFAALETGDFEAAETYVEFGNELGLSEAPADDNARLIYEALLDSYAYSISEDAEVSGISAVLQVELTHLDVDALQEAMEPALEQALQRTVDAKRKADVFDEDGAYLPGVVEQAYADGLENLLEDPAAYLVTEAVDVQLVWGFSGWKISLDAELMNALCGFAAY